MLISHFRAHHDFWSSHCANRVSEGAFTSGVRNCELCKGIANEFTCTSLD
jgi:hypothetical protein